MPQSRTKVASPHARRIARLRRLIAKAGADHLLITNPVDVGYLTGFLGGDSYLLVGPGRPVMISDFRYQEELQKIAPLADAYIRKGSLAAAVADLASQKKPDRLGVQAEHLTLAERDALAALVGPRRLLITGGLVGQLRIRKDEHELRLIRSAIRIQQAALLAVLPAIRPGLSELEIAARLEAEMKSRGSHEVGFQTIVAAGANASLPHHRPSGARVRHNGTLLIDWGAVHQGYHGDMTRTFALGRWPAKMREVYAIVLDAQQLAADALAPGRTTHEIDAVARDHIARHGHAARFGHGLGHGMGMSGHEDPRLNPMFPPATLRPGHVVTVEPGIYLPGVGGVRIEDDYVLTERGARNLCSLPKDIDWATL